MMASAFIDPSIVPLKISDSVAVAIDFFKEFSVRQLPVVQDNICIGILSLDEIEEELADVPVLDFINLSYSFASTVDASGQLLDGKSFHNVRDLKQIFAANPRQLARNLIHQWTVYATGTPVRFSDRREVERILDECSAGQYPVRDLFVTFIQSRIFCGSETL